jgi:hypothetical protein
MKKYAAGGILLFGAAILAHAQDPRKAAIKAFFEKGVLWTHNDSGNKPEIFAINLKGELLARLTVSGANNNDWEAMGIGPGANGKPALYIGDVGDNNFDRTNTAIYRVPEPRINTTQRKFKGDTVLAERFPYRYPDGAHNCETMLVHPQTGAVYLVTKMPDGVSGIYQFPMPLRANETVTLKKLGTVTFKTAFTGRIGDAEKQISDGAISPDGRRVILRNYLTAYEWDIAPNQSVADAMKKPRRQRIIPFVSQGEAICYRPDSKAVYITSENENSPLYEVPLN